MLNEKIKELYFKGFSYGEISEATGLSREAVRTRIRRSDYYTPKNNNKEGVVPENRVTETINADGSRIIEKVIRLSVGEEINPDNLLTAHGFEPYKWKLISATNNAWGQSVDEEGNQVTIYQSKIKVKPLDEYVDWSLIKGFFKENVKPINTPKPLDVLNGDYLVIPLFDLHFGNSKIIDYIESLGRLISIIKKGYKEILIISGGDILNEDNYNGTTASGTLLDKTDMTRAWQEAFQFFEIIITNCLLHANKVSYMYVEGNHDTYSGHTIQLALEQRFTSPRLDFDVDRGVYKARLLGNNFISATHGHKSRVKNYPQIFATEFSTLWGNPKVKTRECYIGHLHTEWSSCDEGGLMIRRTPSRNKADRWHKESGFVTNHKRFMVSEYDETEIKGIYFI